MRRDGIARRLAAAPSPVGVPPPDGWAEEGAAAPWPVVPAPLPGEGLWSWLWRVGRPYGLSAPDLLGDTGLRALGDWPFPGAMPKPGLVAWLAGKTGHAAGEVMAAALPPDVAGSLLGPAGAPATLAAYVRGHRLLSAAKEPVGNPGCAPWADATWPGEWACPGCLGESPEPFRHLAWELPWVLTCPRHGCFLDRVAVRPGALWIRRGGVAAFGRGRPDPVLLRMDGATYEALSTGTARMPAGQVGAAAWLRLLRAVLEELGRLPPGETPQGRAVAEAWADALVPGPPAGTRAVAYERQPPGAKLAFMTAAAHVIDRASSILSGWALGDGARLLTPGGQAGRRPGGSPPPSRP